MFCCCASRSLTDKLNNGDARFTMSLKRMKSKRLVGVAQVNLDPEARAREEFPKADLDGNGSISFSEMKQLLFRLNAYMPKSQMKHLFAEVDVNGDGQLSLEEFQVLFTKADRRETMQRLFKEADQLVNGYVSAQNLFEFFKATAPADEVSGWKPPTIEECGQLIASYVRSNPKAKAAAGALVDANGKPVLLISHFQKLLSDPEVNHLCNPQKVFQVYQDMTHPISHYYISSSHNSYLEGSQTTGTSTPNAIKRALELGVRVIELDVWDGTSEPIVNHGHTLCKPTTFKLCIEAVNSYAFVASSYPVILTIENHCTKKFQEKMAKILSSTLGDKLFKFQASNVSREKLFHGPEEWVTPSDLMEKIVVRDKPKKLHVKKEEKQKVEKKKKSSLKAKGGMEEKEVAEESEDKVSINLNSVSDKSLKESEPPKKSKSGLKSLFARQGNASTKSAMSMSLSEETSGRSLGVSFDSAALSTSQKALTGGGGNLSKATPSTNKAVRSMKNETDNLSTTSLTNDQTGNDEDDDDDEFVDDVVEQEGLGDVVAANLAAKKKDFAQSLNGSIRFAVGKLGVLSEEDLKEKMPQWLQTPPTDLPTNSVQQLLEIVYIKNVKLKFREDKQKRTSIKSITSSSMSLSSSSLSLGPDEFKAIHFVYPDWRSSSSIGEAKMLKLVKPGPCAAALSTYARHHLIRSYPAGTRVDSTNYDPCPAWNAGIQIVALNYQTNGKPVWLNQGKFADNGACGWVLKPKAMLEARSCGRDTPDEEAPEEEAKKYWDLLPHANDPRGDRLIITIVSAHHLPKPLGVNEARSEIIDPFVEVHVSGYQDDECMVKTRYINDNGFNPEFNETFSITLRRPELDLLLFVVKDKDSFGEDFIAQNCFPMNLVRPGYRTVPLRRADSTPIPDAFLFVHVKWERGVVAWA